MPLKTINFPSGEIGCVWLHYFSFPTALAFQNVLPHFYAHPILLSSSFMHNNTVHSDTDIRKGQTGLDWQCHKESRLSHKQESHTDDTCGHYSIFAWLVVIFYHDATGGILEGFYILWGAFSQNFLGPTVLTVHATQLFVLCLVKTIKRELNKVALDDCDRKGQGCMI